MPVRSCGIRRLDVEAHRGQVFQAGVDRADFVQFDDVQVDRPGGRCRFGAVGRRRFAHRGLFARGLLLLLQEFVQLLAGREPVFVAAEKHVKHGQPAGLDVHPLRRASCRLMPRRSRANSASSIAASV